MDNEPTLEQIRAVARKHFDMKKQRVEYDELVRDIAALNGMAVDEEPFALSASVKPTVVIPKQLNNPKFITLWNMWVAMRKKKGLSVNIPTLQHHLKLLDECELPMAYQCLETAYYAEHQTIYNQRYKRNVSPGFTGGQAQGSVQSIASREKRGGI